MLSITIHKSVLLAYEQVLTVMYARSATKTLPHCDVQGLEGNITCTIQQA
jgi:hypothetical protein